MGVRADVGEGSGNTVAVEGASGVERGVVMTIEIGVGLNVAVTVGMGEERGEGPGTIGDGEGIKVDLGEGTSIGAVAVAVGATPHEVRRTRAIAAVTRNPDPCIRNLFTEVIHEN